MGLDISHDKATIEPNDEWNIYYESEFSKVALEQYRFSDYLQDVPDFEFLHTVYFFKTPEDKSYAESKREADGHKEDTVTYLLSSQNTESELVAIEKRYGLNRSEARFSSGGELYPRKYAYKLALYSREIKGSGLYYYEAGYQRKCMDEAFYTLYQSDHIYVAKEDFENLLNHVDVDCHEAYENIKKNFVDAYERGKSMLRISY